MILGGKRSIWIEMEVKPLEVKSKWNERWEKMFYKSSNCCPKGIVLLRMTVPAQDIRKDTLQ